MLRLEPARRRAAIGLVLALVLGLGAEYALFAFLRADAGAARAERSTIVSTLALVALLAAAGGGELPASAETGEDVEAEPAVAGERLRHVVARFAGGVPSFASVRVLDLATTSLVASTAPADRGSAAAPRRLTREEKDLYDQGQRLRSAVETNRQEGGARKEEIEVAATADGGLSVAAPLARQGPGGEVTGSVRAETTELPPWPRPNPVWPLVLFAAALALFFVAAPLLGDRRLPLAALAGVLLVACLVGYARQGLATLRADRQATEEAVASRLVETADLARRVAGAVDLDAAALDPAAWDVDRYRRPYGTVGAGGEIDRARVTVAIDRAVSGLVELLAWIVGLASALLLFVALGFAGRLGATLRKHRQAYFYVTPAILAMLLLVFYPFVYGITLSFTDANPVYNAGKSLAEIWVGFANYLDILRDVRVVKSTPEGFAYNYQNFYWTLAFTIVWTVSNVTFGVTVGLALALLLNTRGLLLRPIYRVLLILPWAVPNYITALIWRGMFHRQFGVINQIVQLFGGPPLSWFESPLTSFFAVLSTNGWLSFPFMMVISLGALQSIPGELYEAARVDGATLWQQFRAITLPSLKPALVPAIIISVIWTFNMFNIIYLTSAGEPAHATEILITQAYKIAFEQYRYGYAAAYATVIFIILLIYGIWQNRVTRATESIG